jgi:biotin carboxylase
LLVANRGEIAIRIARAVADMGLCSIAVHSRDDALAAWTPPTTRYEKCQPRALRRKLARLAGH